MLIAILVRQQQLKLLLFRQRAAHAGAKAIYLWQAPPRPLLPLSPPAHPALAALAKNSLRLQTPDRLGLGKCAVYSLSFYCLLVGLFYNVSVPRPCTSPQKRNLKWETWAINQTSMFMSIEFISYGPQRGCGRRRRFAGNWIFDNFINFSFQFVTIKPYKLLFV
jgi:hypothetical protein